MIFYYYLDEYQDIVEDDRDEGDRDEGVRRGEGDQVVGGREDRDRDESDAEAREDERSEHEREAEIDAATDDDGVVENESAEDQRDFDAGK